jgi:hypothetical protein
MLYRDEVCRDRGYRIADDSLLAVGCCVVVICLWVCLHMHRRRRRSRIHRQIG